LNPRAPPTGRTWDSNSRRHIIHIIIIALIIDNIATKIISAAAVVFVKMQPCPQKNQKLEEGQNSNEAAGDDNLTTSAFERLGTDEIAFIFGFLPPHDIMPARLNKKMRDAAKTTIVPMSQFLVNSVDEYNYNAMDVMTIALPNLQQIEIGYLGSGHKYIDGYDPDERMAAETINFFSHDIEIISNFKMLRSLVVHFAPLNGRYPCLFNFPLLNKLCITTNWKLKWDLEVLAIESSRDYVVRE
jgi:hypothetical protein